MHRRAELAHWWLCRKVIQASTYGYGRFKTVLMVSWCAGQKNAESQIYIWAPYKCSSGWVSGGGHNNNMPYIIRMAYIHTHTHIGARVAYAMLIKTCRCYCCCCWQPGCSGQLLRHPACAGNQTPSTRRTALPVQRVCSCSNWKWLDW